MPEIDITLRSRADPSGIEAMSRGLTSFTRQLGNAAEEYEQFGKKLAKKFSGADFAKDVLSGLGIGSGFAIAEKLAGLVEEHYKKAADAAKEIEASSERSLKATRELIRMRQTPEEQVATLKKQQVELEHEKRDLETPRFRSVTRTTTLHGERETRTFQELVPLTEEEQKRLRELPALINELNTEIAKGELPQKAAAIENALTDFFGPLDAKLKNDLELREQQLDNLVAAARKLGPDMASIKEITPDQEAAAAGAAKHALQELDDEAAKDSIRKAREEVEKFDIAISQLDANPALSDQEKFRQRVDLLNQQTAAIQRLKTELEAFAAAHPGTDVAGLTTAVDQLAKQAATNAAKIQPPQTLAQRDANALSDLSDPSKHFQSVEAGARGGLVAQITQIGTAGDRAARAMQNSFGGAMSSIQQGLNGLIMGTMNLGEAGVSVWNGFLMAASQAFTQMLAEYAVKKAAMFAIDSLYAAKGLALSIANAAKSLIAWIPSAIAASISSFGVAAAVGTAAVLAVAATGFADGGPVAGPGGPRDDRVPIWASNGEWIAPAWQVAHPVYGPMIAALEAGRTGKFANGGLLSWLFPTPKQLLDRTLHPPGSGALGRMLGLSGGGGGSQTFAYNYDTMAWTRDAAGAIARPGYAPNPSTGAGAGGAAGGGQGITIIDGRDPMEIERFWRDPRSERQVVYLMEKNRHVLGART